MNILGQIWPRRYARVPFERFRVAGAIAQAANAPGRPRGAPPALAIVLCLPWYVSVRGARTAPIARSRRAPAAVSIMRFVDTALQVC